MEIQYQQCKNIDLKEVALSTMSFGNMKLEFQVVDSNKLTIVVPKIGELQLEWLVDADLKYIERLNKCGDEKHQVDISTLTLVEIELYEGLCPMIRLTYKFLQEGSFWRSLRGETADLQRIPNNERLRTNAKIGYYCIPLYTKGTFVPW